MLLKIWTAGESSLLSKTFGAALKSMKPEIPPHEFIAWDEEEVPKPGPGEITLVCGVKPLDTLRRHKLITKQKSITTLRETPVPAPEGGHYLVTFDPAITTKEFDKQALIQWDLQLARRLLKTGSLMPPVGKYRWVSSYTSMIKWIEEQFEKTKKPVAVAMDTETMGLYPWYPDRDIVSISFTAQPKTAELLYFGPQKGAVALDTDVDLFEQIVWLLNSPKIKLRGANLKYDLVWIAEKWGIECSNFKADTLLIGSMLDENRSNSLNLHAKLFTEIGGYDDPFNAKYDKGHMEKIPTDDLLIYAGGDTDAAQQTADVLIEELTDDAELTRLYTKIVHPASRAFEKIERRGVFVDREKYAKLCDDLQVVIKETQNQALELLPRKMREKYRERISDQIEDEKNPLLPVVLKEYFFSANGLNLKPKEFTPKPDKNNNPVPAMTKSHLRQFADNPDAKAMVETLTTMDSASKTLSTFGIGFLKHLRPDGRFHPSYMLFKGGYMDDADDESGTNTGRLSAKDPAFQTLPKKTKWAKRLRECFPAPPGKVVISIDYSQGELKIVACVAPEPMMLEAYMKGLDLHAVTGAKLSQTPLEEFLKWKDAEEKALADAFEKHRGNAKPANFGLIYGMSAAGFQAYAWANYGIKLTLAEAEAMRNAFFELYPGLLDYHDNQRNLVRWKEAVRSPLGRVRHLPMIRSWDRMIKSKAERQAINSPIQSALSDMMIWAIHLIEDAYGENIEVVGMIHDALIAYVPAENAEMWAGRAVEIMSNLPLHEVGWQPQLKFTADAEAGPDLANLKKLKFAA